MRLPLPKVTTYDGGLTYRQDFLSHGSQRQECLVLTASNNLNSRRWKEVSSLLLHGVQTWVRTIEEKWPFVTGKGGWLGMGHPLTCIVVFKIHLVHIRPPIDNALVVTHDKMVQDANTETPRNHGASPH